MILGPGPGFVPAREQLLADDRGAKRQQDGLDVVMRLLIGATVLDRREHVRYRRIESRIVDIEVRMGQDHVVTCIVVGPAGSGREESDHRLVQPVQVKVLKIGCYLGICEV